MSSIRGKSTVVALAVTLCAFAGVAVGDVLNVPGDYDSIQAAIDAASTGDEIIVGPGEYHEALHLTKALTLRSSDGAEATTLDGDDERRILLCEDIPQPEARIEGFTFTRGYAPYGAGVRAISCSQIYVAECVFAENHGTSFGGAIQLNATYMTVSACQFASNRTDGYSGGAIHLYVSSHIDLRDSVFESNYCTGTASGGAIAVSTGGSATIDRCLFVANIGESAGAILVWNGGAQVMNSLFNGNVSTTYAGAIESNTPDFSCVNCTFVNNSAATVGGAIYVSSAPAAAVCANSLFWGNSPDTLGDNGGVDASYCNADELLNGDGNISLDPMFVDSVGPDGTPGTGDENLRIGYPSPCIDAGNNFAVIPGADFDLDGKSRFVDDPRIPDTGLGDPPIVDMGAYEFGYTPCHAADFSGDGQVDQTDLGILLAYYGWSDGGDTDGDGDTDQADLGVLLGVYGEICE
jgi:predicted outer membrane repeat protein